MDQNRQGVITLEDDNGKLIDMRVIEMLEYMGDRYVLLQNVNENDDGSYVFRFVEDKDYDKLESIENEDELDKIFSLFEDKIAGSGPVN